MQHRTLFRRENGKAEYFNLAQKVGLKAIASKSKVMTIGWTIKVRGWVRGKRVDRLVYMASIEDQLIGDCA